MSVRTKIFAIAAGVAVFAAVSASAATLGGIKTDNIGANSNVVASSITAGVSLSWTPTYDVTGGYYKVGSVTLTAISGTEKFPAGANVALTLKGTGGASLGEVTATVGASAVSTLTLTPATSIAARDVLGASLVVNGGAVTAVDTTIK